MRRVSVDAVVDFPLGKPAAPSAPHSPPQSGPHAFASSSLAPAASSKADQAQEVIGQIEQYFIESKWGDAERLCKRWLDLIQNTYPVKTTFYHFLGFALMKQEKFDEAAEVATKGIELRAGDYFTRAQLGIIFTQAMQRRNMEQLIPSAAAGPAK